MYTVPLLTGVIDTLFCIIERYSATLHKLEGDCVHLKDERKRLWTQFRTPKSDHNKKFVSLLVLV